MKNINKIKLFLLSFIIKNIMLFSAILTNSIVFWIILKYFQKISNNKIKSFFITYPAEKRYADFFLFKWLQKKLKWKIFCMGVHFQNGNLGFNFATTINEKEMLSPKNIEKFEEFIKTNIKLKKYVGVPYINYGGIFPSVISKRKLENNQSATPEIISKVILDSVFKMLETEKLNENDCVFYILGGGGYIGKKVSNLIKNKKLLYQIVEKGDSFEKFSKKNKIIINIARKGAFEEYQPFLEENTYLINEVFPPPKISKENKIIAYHIKGINAKIFPSMPYDYSNVMPCCSLVSNNNQTKFDVVIKKIKKRF